MTLLSSSALAFKAATIKNKGLIAEAYEWDEEEVSLDDNEMVEVKVLMELAEENDSISKEGARNGEWVKISMRKVHTLLEMEDNVDRKTYLDYLCIDLNYVEEQRNNLLNTTDTSFTDSSTTECDSTDESSVCSTPLPPLKKLDGAEPISGPKTIKSILSSSASKVNSAPVGKLKSVKIKDDPPLAIVMKELNNLKLKISMNQSSYSINNQPQQYERSDHRTCDHVEYISTKNMSQHLKILGRSSSRPKNPRPSKHFFPPCIHYGFSNHLSDDCVNYPICDICGSYDHDTHGHNRIISLRRVIKPRNSQHVMKSYETCGSTFHTTTDHNDIEWFRSGEELQAKKAEALKSSKAESSNANRSKTPTRSGCSRHMTSVKSYLHKYVEQPGPKVVFGDDSTCTSEGYGSIKCNGIVFTKVAFVNGLKYNLISISQLCDAKYIVQFDKKRGTIFNSNKEVVMIAPRDKPCSSCEKGKHHRASFKTKQTSFIKNLHLLHMDLFVPVTPRSINHEKYTLVIVDEYSRNSILVNFCDEKGISLNFSSPYTPEQNGVAERKNTTLIEDARTMLSGSVFSKQY
ncbi:retrovirus-related pol polyprotein from transposon TNT 1-94 [Tanacetum coccineum]